MRPQPVRTGIIQMIYYKPIKEAQINIEMFRCFNRYQKVSKCWRKDNKGWTLKDIPFIKNWNADDLSHLVSCLKQTAAAGGAVIGAFADDDLVGFSSIESGFFGEQQQYLQLSNLHVSHEYRSLGIGKTLFLLSADKAREMGAKKLYISAHSSEETQAFYKAMHCIEAQEYNQKLAEAEPCDCQLEFIL